MSWLNNLAGKAESLLNNIDQSAAVAISKTKETENDELQQDYRLSNVKQSPITKPNKVDVCNKSNKSAQLPLSAHKKAVSQTRSNKDKDDALFDFLNSDIKLEKTRSVPSKMNVDTSINSRNSESDALLITAPQILGMSRSSSSGILSSKVSEKSAASNGSNSSEAHENTSESDVLILPSIPTDSTTSESEFEIVASQGTRSVDDCDSPSEKSVSGSETEVATGCTDLKMENQLLRNEIASLHQEVTQMRERNKKRLVDVQRRNEELQNQCEDMKEEIKVKSTQLMVLERNCRESENFLKIERETVGSLKAENNKLLLDQSEGNDIQVMTMESLRSRLEETESLLAIEKRKHDDTRRVAHEYEMQQQQETRKISESLQKSESTRIGEKQKLDDLINEARTTRNNLSAVKQELQDYKTKATRILQSKERLIASLKGETDMTSSTLTSMEIEEARQERDAARDELSNLRIELSNLKLEYQDLEQQYQHEQATLQQENLELQRQIQESSTSLRETESELTRALEERRRDQEEYTRLRTSANTRIQEKDLEIDRLRNQLVIRTQSTPQESELESRLRQLTETVIQKQSAVETLCAEKNSLLLQMERMEGQIKRLSQQGGSHVTVNLDGELTNQRTPSGHVTEYNPGISYGVVGQVRKAASVLDKFSIRLGVFLKRYPPARLFVLLYMAILHIWVMIVLLTYTPEAHSEDFFHGMAADAGKRT